MFLGIFDSAIPWVVGLLVVATIVAGVVIPGVSTVLSSSNIGGTATAEIWNGTASTAHLMANKPIISVSDFRNSTAASTYNDTLASGNGSSANATKTFTFTYPDNGFVSGKTYTINPAVQVGNGANVSLYLNGHATPIATIVSTSTPSFAESNLESPLSITYVFNGANVSNVTNTTINYYAFATNTNYSVSNALIGQITPTINGTFYTTYVYGNSNTTQINVVLYLLPFLIAVVLLLLIVYSASWISW